ncbi:MAG: DUF6475 domain-containing protein [Acidovorax sp.]|uniref:DUF6475 domain-containing protein n=1 Tax=Acidovorax sp. TaxID=1872122 RepID=UPI00391D7064
MNESERRDFGQLVKDVMAYYRQDTSAFLLTVWWNACKPFELEQIQQAMQRHMTDAEHGQFAPKVADMARMLVGTATDRALVAWGKVHEAMSAVGAYQDVVFDDPAIHAVIEDLGGWVKVCRTDLKEVGYLQHKFCESHRAYTRLPSFDYPRKLGGAADGSAQYARFGLPPPKPVVVGDIEKARQVMRLGSSGGKTAITTEITALLASRSAQQRLTNDEKSHGKADTSVA